MSPIPTPPIPTPPTPATPSSDPIQTFIARWDGTAMAERANGQQFLPELCDILQVPRPDPATGGQGDYRFERNVTHHHDDGSTSTGRIDLYKRDCFVCETKQGANERPEPALFTLEPASPRNECYHPPCI